MPLATECRVSLIMAMFGSHLLNSLHLKAALFVAVTAMGRYNLSNAGGGEDSTENLLGTFYQEI